MNRLSPALALIAMLALSAVLSAQPVPEPAAAPPDGAPAASLPVSRIVLFSSGVGYFEHAGTVDGDAAVTLQFKPDQINDVLKSMVVMDLDGGTVPRVTYGSRDPLARALSSFAIDLSGDPSVANILKQIRGATVTALAPEPVTGKVLGVEAVQKQVVANGVTTILTENVLSLLTANGIKTLPLDTLQSIKFENDKLQEEITRALELLMESHDMNRKPVSIYFQGQGKRKVRVGYVIETPVWKTSYRLDLSGDKPLLQGWAIVENTSDSDWENVTLSLVSGRPISFIMDLYTPLYAPRPVVEPELYASLRPQQYGEGIASEKRLEEAEDAFARKSGAARRERGAAPGQPMLGAYADAAPAADRAVELARGVQSIAAAAEIGELFQFTLADPVTLPRRRSAMLPIVNAPIAAEQVSLYNPSVLPTNPLNGAYLVNDTGMKLLAGPVTVFNEGMYAGDARVGNLAQNDKRFLSYAIDLNVTVDPSQRTESQIVSATIVDGVLEVRRLYTYIQQYKIENNASAPRTLIIEQPRNAQRKLIEPEAAFETTPELYRFRTEVPPGKTQTFTVKEQYTQGESIALLREDPSRFAWYLKSGEISPDVRDALQKAADMKVQITRLREQLNQLQQQKQAIEAGQERLRKNIETVGKDSELGRRYLKKLSEEEDQIERLQGQIEELRKQLQALETQLGDYLRGLKVR